VLLSKDLKFIQSEVQEKLNTEINEIKKMLIAFIKKLKA